MKLNIEIDNEKSTIKETDESGFESVKEVLTEDLLSAFSEHDTEYESPVLPGPYGVRRFVKKGKSTYYLFIEAPREVTLEYNMEHYENNYEDLYDDLDEVYDILDMNNIDYRTDDEGYEIAIINTVAPTTVWMVEAVDSNEGMYFSKMKVFSLKEPVITGLEQLYRYPFSNIYPNAEVCWGDVMLSAPSVQAIQGLSTRFLGSLFNLDLHSNVTMIDTEYGSYDDTLIAHAKVSHDYATAEEKLEGLHQYMKEYRHIDEINTVDEKFHSFVQGN